MLSNVANMFDDSGDAVSIIVMDSNKNSFFHLNKGIKILPLDNELPNGKLEQLLCAVDCVTKLRKLIKTINPDVVLSFWTSRAIISIIAGYKLGIPIVACEHTAYCKARMDANIIRWIIYRFAAAIVSLTREDALRYKKINKNTYVIPNGVNDLKILHRHREEEKVVLFVGRWSREKGIDMLIDAWNRIARKYSGWKLRIIGDKEDLKYVDEVNEKIDKYKLEDSIEIKQPTNEIMEEYDKADIFVLPSRWEGLPMVLLEAMSRGVAVVSFDCPTGPRDIIKDNETGFLVEADNIEMLSKRIELLINEKKIRKEIGERANKDIYINYNCENIKKMWWKMLDEVIRIS